MNKITIDMIMKLLENYNEHLKNKSDMYADRMSDYAEISDECVKWSDKYQVVRIERQRVHEAMRYLENELNLIEAEVQ